MFAILPQKFPGYHWQFAAFPLPLALF